MEKSKRPWIGSNHLAYVVGLKHTFNWSKSDTKNHLSNIGVIKNDDLGIFGVDNNETLTEHITNLNLYCDKLESNNEILKDRIAALNVLVDTLEKTVAIQAEAVDAQRVTIENKKNKIIPKNISDLFTKKTKNKNPGALASFFKGLNWGKEFILQHIILV